VAPDPALAFGEPNEPGTKLLEACRLSMDSTPIFYLTGDVHLVFGLLAAIEMGALSRGPAAAATLIAIVGLTFAVRVRRQRPAATWALSILFGAILGLAPPRPSPPLGDRPARTVYMVSVVVAQAFLGSFVLGARPRRPLRVGVRQRLPRA